MRSALGQIELENGQDFLSKNFRDGKNSKYQAILGRETPNHCGSVSSSLMYNIRWTIDEKFRGFSAFRGGSVAICMLLGVVAFILWEFDRNAGDDVTPLLRMLTAWEGHQTSPYSMCERLECSRYSHSRAVVHDKALRRRKISLIFREFFQSSGKKRENGHRLITLKYVCRGELSSLPRYYVRSPFDETFRGFWSNVDTSMPTSMIVEVGGGNFSTKFLILNCGPNRQQTQNDVVEGHQTLVIYIHNGLL